MFNVICGIAYPCLRFSANRNKLKAEYIRRLPGTGGGGGLGWVTIQMKNKNQ